MLFVTQINKLFVNLFILILKNIFQFMQFVKLKRFQHKELGNSLHSGLSASKDPKFSEKLKITTFRYSYHDQTITLGLNNGFVMQFVNQRFSQKKLTQTKDFDIKKFNHITNPHKGQIRCLLYEKIFDQFYIITGSSDRTIKIWDSDPKSKEVTQTIIGHNGSVLALSYSKLTDTLFSSSNDKSIRIWKQQKQRNFFMHPWYVCYQIISEFTTKKVENPVYVTSFELRDGEKDRFTLFAGDSEGTLHQIRLKQINENLKKNQSTSVFILQKSNPNYHRLTIHKILSVPKQNIIFTLSFDQMVIGYQQTAEKQFFKFKNPHKHVFTSCVWFQGLLILADDSGCLYFAEINTEKQIEELQKYDSKIIGLQYIRELDELLIASESYVDVVKIKRGVKSGEGNSHKDSIVSILALQPYKITNKKVKDSPKIITVSLDNTMRIWDPLDLTCISVLENIEKNEIVCLSYLKHANLFVTGHENGSIRLWNIQLGNSITIDQTQNPLKHKNTICTLESYIYERGNEDITQYLFTAGYEGKINVWEIFEKKNIVQSSLMSSTICPQLKHSVFPDQTQKQPDKIGYEILALAIYEQRSQSYDQESIRLIVAAGNSGKIYFIKMFTYEHLEPINAHDDSINTLVIDQKILFSGSHDKTIKLWSLQDKTLLTSLKSTIESGIRSLLLIEQTGHLVSTSNTGEIEFWDYPRKAIVKKINEKNERVNTITYVNELKTLFVGTQQSNIYTQNIQELYKNVVLKPTTHHTTQMIINDKTMQQFLKKNERQLQQLMKK